MAGWNCCRRKCRIRNRWLKF